MKQGYIKIFRSLLDNPIWCIKPFAKGQAWLDILMLTNHKTGYIRIKNGEMLTIKRGECGVSVKGLANRWGWSRGKVQRFFDLLVEQEMIQQTIQDKHSTIRVLRFNDFQNDTTNSTTNDTTNGQQTDTNNNGKNGKNNNNKVIVIGEKTKNFSPPTLEEVKAYLDERGSAIEAASFIDFYESKGWMIGKNKMKDWKAAVRTWERNKTETARNRPRLSDNKDLPYNGFL